MARRGGRPSPQNMMKQIQEMQAQMAEEQSALENETVEVSVGGGVVVVVMNGHQKLQSVEIKDELLDPEESEMLRDLIVAAVNEAVERSQSMAADRMSSITQGLNLPPGLGLG